MWSRLSPCSKQLYNLKVTVIHTQSSDTSAAKQLNHNSIKPFKALSKHFLLPSKVRHKQIYAHKCLKKATEIASFFQKAEAIFSAYLSTAASYYLLLRTTHNCFMLSPNPALGLPRSCKHFKHYYIPYLSINKKCGAWVRAQWHSDYLSGHCWKVSKPTCQL